MSNETIFWAICLIVVFLVSAYHVYYWANSKISKNIIENKKICLDNDILHNKLIEILYCHKSGSHNICLCYKNKSNRTIKYLTCNCNLINTVNDYIVLNSGKNSIVLKDVGPIFTNSFGGGIFSSYDVDDCNIIKVKIISIEIEYMDKTKIFIDELSVNDAMINKLN